jgi:hypothetical protein
MEMGAGSLRGLIYPRATRTRRISSWDRTGRNDDFVRVEAGATAVLADISGSGCLNHIWITANAEDSLYLRQVVLRMFWDGEATPSVESPLGDFFGVGHARASHFLSLPLSMITGGDPAQANQAAMNCYFPMPFAAGARLTLANESARPLRSLYYHLDFEERAVEAETLRFHAHWRRDHPTSATMDLGAPGVNFAQDNAQANLHGGGNYLILEAEGRGHFVGSVLSVDHVNPIPGFGWFGEGDDMIFIDGEVWPPSLHGTGTEDYFCAAWGFPSGKYNGPYHGVSLAGPNVGPLAYSGQWTMYRFHIEDPICFSRSIRVTIEHGHANCQADDFASVAYWYQTEPHRPFPALLPVAQRLPLPEQESLRHFNATI